MVKKSKKLKKFICLLLIIGCLGFGLAIYAFFIEPNLIAVNRKTLTVPHWRVEDNGFKIAVLADLHVGSPFIDIAKLEQIVQKTNDLKPDVVVIVGDFVVHGVVGGHFVEPEKIADVLKGLKSPIGTISVLGNHDWWVDGPRIWKALEDGGQIVLENEVYKVPTKTGEFWFAGIADKWTSQPDIPGTMDKIDDDNPIIVLTHNPDLFTEISSRVSLTLAGHTHGGQVNLPVVGRLVVPSDFGQRYAAGYVVEEGRHLFVGTGVGTSILPVRFRVIPEIVILTINGK